MLPRLTRRNWSLKLSCLALAIVLWFLMIGEPEVVTVEAVPLSYGNLAPDLVLLSDPPDAIRVELRGASREIARQNLAGIKVLLDFASVQAPGERTFVISENQLNLPNGVTFLRAVPAQLLVNFDRVTSREVPVDVRFKGKPADGFRISRKRVTPEQVRISGPVSRVNEVNLTVAEVDVADKAQDFTVNVPPSPAVAGVRLDSPSTVHVEIAIEKGNSLPE